MARVLALEKETDLPMAKGQEEAARKFYGKLLGMREVMKTPGERGVWFEVGGVKLRLRAGDSAPAYSDAVKAHLTVDNVESLRRAAHMGRYRTWDAPAMAGSRGVVLADPFGNRVELREYKAGATRERVREDAGSDDA